MGTRIAQRVFIALELRFKGIICEPLIAGKRAQLRLRAPRTRAQELHKQLEDAHVSVDGGTHPPTLRETRASRGFGAPFKTEKMRSRQWARIRCSR